MKTFKMLRTAAIIGYTMLAVVLFSSCDKVTIEQEKSLHGICEQKYIVSTSVWVKSWWGKPISLEMYVQESCFDFKADSILKHQMDSALIIQSRVNACLNNR